MAGGNIPPENWELSACKRSLTPRLIMIKNSKPACRRRTLHPPSDNRSQNLDCLCCGYLEADQFVYQKLALDMLRVDPKAASALLTKGT